MKPWQRAPMGALAFLTLAALTVPPAQAEVSLPLVRRSLILPSTPVGSSSERSFTVKNYGSTPMQGTVGTLSAPFKVLSGAGPFTLAADASLNVVVGFVPTVAGLSSSTLAIRRDNGTLANVYVIRFGSKAQDPTPAPSPSPKPAPAPAPTPSPSPNPQPVPSPSPQPAPSPQPPAPPAPDPPATNPTNPSAGIGPRHPLGPDVPLTETEKTALARRVTVNGFTAAAVRSACSQAINQGVPVVFLPAGQYVFEASVKVPSTLTLLGEGSKTVCVARSRSTVLFQVAGDRVRFTRLTLQGADTNWSETNDSEGIDVHAKQNIRVDHCELMGFRRAVWFDDVASGQIDHCTIHHNLRAGFGYGVQVSGGAYALVTDSEFSQCRHVLASIGALDWDNAVRLGKYVHLPGVRLTHWEFRQNYIHGNELAQVKIGQLDTHPGMDGTFVILNNVIENVRLGTNLSDGSGLVRGNLFRDFTGYSGPAGVYIWHDDNHNGIPVEGAMPHDIRVLENTFVNVPQKYRIDGGVNISVDGAIVPSTQKPGAPAPPPIPRLYEMGDDGILRWDAIGY